MSLLGKYTENFIDEEDNLQDNSYTTPAVLKDDEDISLKKSIVISTILHPTAVGAAWLIVFILALMGVTFSIFDKPKPKVQDIEFVLVDKEETPINKNTPYRADINSRAGGHHDPTRKVSMPSPAPGVPKQAQAAKPKAASAKPAPKTQPKNPIQKMIQQVTQPQPPQPKAKPTPKPAAQAQGPKKVEQARPQPPTARPSLKPPMTPRPVAKPSSPFSIPVPSGGTKTGHYSTGPISGSGSSAKGGSAGGGSSAGRYAPTPSLAPTGGSGSSAGSKLAKGGGGGTGGYGNPGPGNPNGRPGIDAVREPDFGPYMRELQRRIKMNWDPPKGNESKRVVLMFKIAKDGRLLSCSVFKSSGLPSADKAAINAVQLTAPFRPLPAEYKGSSIDIQFTFDYNVFGASGYH